MPAAYNVGLYVVQGQLTLHDNRSATTKQLVVYGWDSAYLQLSAATDTQLLVMAGAR